ncbi:MAG: hypothetical protein QM817_30220 [Archangium sp.]
MTFALVALLWGALPEEASAGGPQRVLLRDCSSTALFFDRSAFITVGAEDRVAVMRFEAERPVTVVVHHRGEVKCKTGTEGSVTVGPGARVALAVSDFRHLVDVRLKWRHAWAVEDLNPTERGPEFIDRGDEVPEWAPEQSRIVPIVSSTGAVVCTATRVRHDGKRWFLTAAHCLLHKNGTLRRDLFVDRKAITAESALVDQNFFECSRREDYRECLNLFGNDVALLPAGDGEVFDACASSGVDQRATIFGYGLDQGRAPGKLQSGDFYVTSWREKALLASPQRDQMINLGDSGGSGFSLDARQCPAWVSSGVLNFNGLDRAVLIPVSTAVLNDLTPVLQN